MSKQLLINLLAQSRARTTSKVFRGTTKKFSTGRRLEESNAYILGASRTPVGVFNGSFTSVSAPKLASIAIKSALEKSNVPLSNISEAYIGHVLQANTGQAPARQAVIGANLSTSIEATTINKVCASGLKAVSLGAQAIQLGQSKALIAGGMENMTRVPLYLPRSSQQSPFGNVLLKDGLIEDGLTDVYNQINMGLCAENTVKVQSISREEQDQYAILSYKRAQDAWSKRLFDEEIVPVSVDDKVIKEDEQYKKLKLEKISKLKPVFDRSGNGTITAANSSPLSDGASALILGNKEVAKQYGQNSKVLAKIIAYADAAVDPIDFPIAPSKVIPLVLERSGLKKNDISLWEINEAFAAVVIANCNILGLDLSLVNQRGGAISLGHALGNSGSRILISLLHQLEPGQFGCAAICNGGGASTGMIVQRIAYKDVD